MKQAANNATIQTPMLFPFAPEEFWIMIRQIISEEISKVENEKTTAPAYEISGMTYKPLFKMVEVCKLFQVSKPTIYEWIKHGKLKPHKIRSRVYFLWDDIQKLLNITCNHQDLSLLR